MTDLDDLCEELAELEPEHFKVGTPGGEDWVFMVKVKLDGITAFITPDPQGGWTSADAAVLEAAIKARIEELNYHYLISSDSHASDQVEGPSRVAVVTQNDIDPANGDTVYLRSGRAELPRDSSSDAMALGTAFVECLKQPVRWHQRPEL